MGQKRAWRVQRKRQRRPTAASETFAVARSRARLQLQQLAAALGLHARTIARWEIGETHPSKAQWSKTIAYLARFVPHEAVELAKAAGVASPFPEAPPVDVRAIEEGLLRAAVREVVRATASARGTLADLARAAEEKTEGDPPRSP